LSNHLKKEFGTFIFIIKHKIKEESLRKCSIFLSIKPNSIFNEVSQEKGFICPEYSIIRYQIIRSISNQLNLDKTTFNEMPIESEYYKTKKGKAFMISPYFNPHSKQNYFHIIVKLYLSIVYFIKYQN